LTVKQQLEDMCERFGAETLYVFGSRSREVKDLVEGRSSSLAGPSSDVDIGLKLRPGSHLSIREKARLSAELENILDVNRIDLCVLHEADPFLAADIIRGERIYCEDEYRADEYELYVLRGAGDLVPLERERLRFVFKEPRGSA
jgi:predicted nucleotidyltransferase